MSDRPPKVKCEICGKTYMSRPVLRIHMSLEHGQDLK